VGGGAGRGRPYPHHDLVRLQVDQVVDALREKLAPEEESASEALPGEKNHTASLLQALGQAISFQKTVCGALIQRITECKASLMQCERATPNPVTLL
jgi:hypothetical protein